jgi:ankyrin repeat protein
MQQKNLLLISVLFLTLNSNFCMNLNEELLKNAKDGDLEKVTELVLYYKADVNAQNNYDWTALHYSAGYGHFEIVQFLINNGANLNAQNTNGSTALHQAANKGDLEIVHLLLKNKANIDPRDTYNKTPLNQATQWGHRKIAHLLLNYGANCAIISEFHYYQPTKDFLTVYRTLEKQTKESPSADVLKEAIKNDFAHLVKLLIQHNYLVTKEHLALAKHYNSKQVGYLLTQSLGLKGPQMAISKSGITKINDNYIAPEITDTIGSYLYPEGINYRPLARPYAYAIPCEFL